MNRGGSSRWQQIGADGAWALLLTCLVILATLGLSWLAMLWQAWHVAATTPARVPVKDWVVVLGRRLLGGAVTLDYAARLKRAATLWREHPRAHIMVLGGHTTEGPFSEAMQGRNFLRQRGVPEERIHIEDRSLHTLENLQNARQLMDGGIDEPLVLVTSRYHLARCRTLAAGMGLPHLVCAAEERLEWRPALPWRLALEAFLLHWYWVGRIWSTLTRNHKSLARLS